MSQDPTTVLIVEDDPDIRRLVGDLLAKEGFAIELVDGGATMDAALTRIYPDLIILDVMLPGEDGLSICRRLRAQGSTPILMLTARNEEIDKVLGLELGADDYLVKPFGPRELVARARALVRRSKTQPTASPTRRLTFEGFVVDLDARELRDRTGALIALTSGEFDLLSCFVQRPRRVLSRDQILDCVRGRSAEPFDRTVDMLVSRLRKKLEDPTIDGHLITTVRNGGYLFTATVRQTS